MATRIGIIHNGKLIEELDTQKLERLRGRHLEVQARDLSAAQLCLQSAGFKYSIKDETIIINDPHALEHPDYIAHILVNAGTPPTRTWAPWRLASTR